MIDWSKAPEWAQFHAFSADGRGGWYQNYPTIQHWFWSQHGYSWPSGYSLPNGEDWRDSLTERVKVNQ